MKQIVLFVGAFILFNILFGTFVKFDSQYGSLGGEVSLTDPGVVAPQQSLQLRSLVPVTPTPGSPGGGTPPAGTTPFPTNTPIPPLCQGKKAAFNILIDTSGSMSVIVSSLRDALVRLGDYLGNDTIVGVQQFSRTPGTLIPIGRFNKASYTNTVRGIQITGRDETYMYDGFVYSENIMNQARGDPQNAGYIWKFIFLSDGVPNDATLGEGPDSNQDPTPIASRMKPAIEIFTIGIGIESLVRRIEHTVLTDQELRNYARSLMIRVASPGNYKPAASGNDLLPIFEQIVRNVCI